MKRAAFVCTLISVCLAAGLVASGQSAASQRAGAEAKKTCPFNITGLWRSEAATETTSTFFNFSPKGWVALQRYSADTLPEDFEILTTVSYKLDKPAAPKQIEFTTARGNDAFPQGVTVMEITEFSDDSFTTLDFITGQKTRWVREQTHRYFLTLAARSGTPQQRGPAFAMWTTLDGRQTKVEALGVQVTTGADGKPLPVFGPIPAEVYEGAMQESVEEDKRDKGKKDHEEEAAVMRLELTAAEFERTHAVFEAWEKSAKGRSLPNADAYQNGAEFLTRAISSLNRCGEKLKLDKLPLPSAGVAAKDNPGQQTLELIRAIRKKNEDLHVPDVAFPWGWRPTLQLNGQ